MKRATHTESWEKLHRHSSSQPAVHPRALGRSVAHHRLKGGSVNKTRWFRNDMGRLEKTRSFFADNWRKYAVK